MSGYRLRAVVGLGNPGIEYARSRHNAGFWLVDQLAGGGGGDFRIEPKFRGETARARLDSHDLLLLKPATFMNLSGESVQPLAAYYRLRAEDILIVHDDLDLPPGTARIRRGGHGRHNGLRSVLQHLGDGYLRLRIGIGHPGHRDAVTNYVLGRPNVDQQIAIDRSIDAALAALTTLLDQGLDKAMQQLHSDDSSVAQS